MNRLADLTWPELDASRRLLVVPVGSTEQHGPHLPFGTDTEIAIALSDRLAARRVDAVVAPALPYGSSGEHAGFPGTLSIGQATLEAVIVELVRSAALTFDAIVFVCGHGGNAEALTRAVARMRDEGHDLLVFFPRWEGDAHAGRTETSLMLAVAHESVRGERAEPGDTRDLAALLPSLRSGGVRAVSPNGVLGDPRGATASAGHALLDAALADLVEQVDRWRS
ncbi:MAG TPA: mycofactocin biosynthesis peptidyl-dipeptidase MftE [Mycobacteriales bacterium]|nr:mycofactocin biosynthesis peptidyl-dipeptidase MftE [Mycobacteriales bacterium]